MKNLECPPQGYELLLPNKETSGYVILEAAHHGVIPRYNRVLAMRVSGNGPRYKTGFLEPTHHLPVDWWKIRDEELENHQDVVEAAAAYKALQKVF